MSIYQNNAKIPQSEQSINHLLGQIANSFEKKYKMKTIATNVSMPEGVVKLLGLDFQIRGPLPKEEIRKLLIELNKEFIALVNSDENVRSHLEHYPFEIRNIEITLFFIDSHGHELDDPYIGIAGISRGRIDYQTIITNNGVPSVKNEFVESYEEALEALKENFTLGQIEVTET
jgi:hypothetical protein